MAVCLPSALMQSAKCFCKVTVRPYEMAELQLLCQIAQSLSPGMNCDVPTLMQQAKCFCSITDHPVEMVKLQLLCNIFGALGGGGGGGTGAFTCGVTIPVTPPAGSCGFYIRQQSAQTALYAWDGSQWQAIVGT